MKATLSKELLLVGNATTAVREQLSAALGGLFELSFAEGDEKIVLMARREKPTLILLESSAPGSQAFDLCQRIVQEDSLCLIPVIIIVDRHSLDAIGEGFYQGMSDYVLKPLIPAELLVRIGGQVELAYANGMMNQVQRREKRLRHTAAHSPTKHDYLAGRRRRILIVDDYPGNREALADALGDLYEVATASNGREAVEMALNDSFDIILLDVVMPEVDGFEACRQLKSHESTCDIPIIFLTGMMDAQDEVRGFELGAVDYIAKPYSLTVVMARIRNHLLAAHNKQELKSISFLDGLTNIPNRRQFDYTLEKEYQRAIRDHNEISLLLIDIDHFKPFNDNYGHLAGDRCLQRVSQALAQCQKRASDFVGRYGGEEFVALLPDTDARGAEHMAQCMLEAIRSLNIPHAFSNCADRVTISIGVASCSPKIPGEGVELIRMADELLYHAKRSGRNRMKTGRLSITSPSQNRA